MAWLALVRHGVSKYNAKGIWTGWENPDITKDGIKEAELAAQSLIDIKFDEAFSSDLLRATHTLDVMKNILKLENLPTYIDKALRERDYGVYTLKNKWEVKEKIGEEEFQKLRRGWDYPIPEGESLKQVYERVVPYFENIILPELKKGKNVLVSSSGNTLRALKKYLEKIPEEEVAEIEIATGEIGLYEIDPNGIVLSHEVRASHPNTV